MLNLLQTLVTQNGSRTVQVAREAIEGLPEQFDALVSSDDNHLSHGGGISRALWKAAGPEFQLKVESEKPPLRLGDVYPTRAGRLRSEWILHVITIDFDANRTIDAAELPGAIGQTLLKAEDLGCKSVALPLVGSGAAGVSIADVCDAIGIAIEDWLRSPSQLRKIAVVTGRPELPKLTRAIRNILAEIETPEKCAERIRNGLPGKFARRWADTAAIPPFSRAFSLAELMSELLTACTSITESRLESAHSPRRLRKALADFPRELRTRIVTAVYVRNRLMHETSGSATLDDLITLNRAIYELICWFHRDATNEIGLGVAGEEARPEPDLKSRGMRRTDGEPVFLTPTALLDTGSAVAPVRKLQRLLLRKLEPEVLSRIDAALQQRGMVGTPDMRLLEGLLTTSPLDFLAGELSRHELEPVMVGLIADSNQYDAKGLARMLLRKLGFPIPESVKGLASVIRSVKSARSRLLVPQLSDIDGAVNSCAKHLEYVCQVLIRFLCFAAFKQAPEPFFQARQNLPPGKPISKCSLGTLLTLTEEIAKAIASDASSPSVTLFRACFDTDDPFPKGVSKLAKVRNSFLHFQSDMVQQSREQRAKKAIEFLDATLDFLYYLERTDPRIFPTIVRIDQVLIDNWGRELIQVITDDGMTDVVFTDQSLDPGRVYFMHPLTNPLRVDPILIPAGDLTWPDDPA